LQTTIVNGTLIGPREDYHPQLVVILARIQTTHLHRLGRLISSGNMDSSRVHHGVVCIVQGGAVSIVIFHWYPWGHIGDPTENDTGGVHTGNKDSRKRGGRDLNL